jgi:hypothetical protein
MAAKEEKAFKCTCGASYTHEKGLKEHLKKGSTKEFQCERLLQPDLVMPSEALSMPSDALPMPSEALSMPSDALLMP